MKISVILFANHFRYSYKVPCSIYRPNLMLAHFEFISVDTFWFDETVTDDIIF